MSVSSASRSRSHSRSGNASGSQSRKKPQSSSRSQGNSGARGSSNSRGAQKSTGARSTASRSVARRESPGSFHSTSEFDRTGSAFGPVGSSLVSMFSGAARGFGGLTRKVAKDGFRNHDARDTYEDDYEDDYDSGVGGYYRSEPKLFMHRNPGNNVVPKLPSQKRYNSTPNHSGGSKNSGGTGSGRSSGGGSSGGGRRR